MPAHLKIELVYFEGCPNAVPAQRELTAAVDKIAPGTTIQVWEQDNSSAPDYVRSFGSPTILLNGTDLFGESPQEKPCCRLYGDSGYPTRTAIIDRLVSRLSET